MMTTNTFACEKKQQILQFGGYGRICRPFSPMILTQIRWFTRLFTKFTALKHLKTASRTTKSLWLRGLRLIFGTPNPLIEQFWISQVPRASNPSPQALKALFCIFFKKNTRSCISNTQKCDVFLTLRPSTSLQCGLKHYINIASEAYSALPHGLFNRPDTLFSQKI
jgi:hypothetical protein